MSEIQQFYKNKRVFLTGGTGFVGKLIIEKLLRTTDVSAIYIIIRPMKNHSVEERSKDLLEHKIFSEVRNKTNKIKILEGDLKELNLGLSERNRKTLEDEVDIIIHCGAFLNMGERMKDSVLSNVRSTREIIDIAKNCKKLVSLIYVSTTYSYCPKPVIDEKFYDAPVSPHLLISMVQEMEDGVLQQISPGLRGQWPNFYAFTKAVSESLVKDAAKSLPVGLLRPSVTISTADEPKKGWTDSMYGPLGVMFNANMGILRAIHGNPSTRVDMVPADKVVNATLCLAWEIEQQWNKQKGIQYNPPVLNVSGKDSPIYIKLDDHPKKMKVAMKKAIWYPDCYYINNRLVFTIWDKLFHRIPYYILDRIAMIRGNRSLASRVFNNASKVCSTLHYFMVREWTFKNDNVVALWNKLSDEDRKLYDFDVRKINPDDYFHWLAMGLKQYLAKEDIADIDKHEKRLMRLKIIHYCTIGVLMATISAMVTALSILILKYIT